MPNEEKRVSGLLDDLQRQGRYGFDRVELEKLMAVSSATFGKALLRLAAKNRVRRIRRSFHVILPVEYSAVGMIVQEIQGGKGRAEYGRQVLADLSLKLTKRYGDGFSETTLQYFRKFYLAYANRHFPIPRPLGVELPTTNKPDENSRPLGVEFVSTPPPVIEPAIRHPAGDELPSLTKNYPAGSKSLVGFPWVGALRPMPR
jgi:hypothetical protein